jgi:hypothetical protein
MYCPAPSRLAHRINKLRSELSSAVFEKSYEDYVAAAQDPGSGEEPDAVRLYISLQQLIGTRTVTVEQISRKVEILMKLQDCLENQNDFEQMLLASIKRDLDEMR